MNGRPCAWANINLNFPDNWINTVSIALQLLQCYYLIFYTNVVLVMVSCGGKGERKDGLRTGTRPSASGCGRK